MHNIYFCEWWQFCVNILNSELILEHQALVSKVLIFQYRLVCVYQCLPLSCVRLCAMPFQSSILVFNWLFLSRNFVSSYFCLIFCVFPLENWYFLLVCLVLPTDESMSNSWVFQGFASRLEGVIYRSASESARPGVSRLGEGKVALYNMPG